MQMLENENTISKIISPHGRLEPNRSKREEITNELMMKLLTIVIQVLEIRQYAFTQNAIDAS